MITRARAWLAEQADGGRRATTLVVLVLLGLLLGWIVWGRTQAEGEAEQADQKAQLATDNAQEIAGEVRDACERRGEVAALLGDLCRQAEKVAEQPAEQVLVPPSDEQLRPLVAEYVAQWLTANPPRDGRDGTTPTTAEISALITAELAANPPPAGEDGRTPTAADIRPIVVEEVAAFLLANPPPPGEDGQDGTDGEDGTDGADGADGQPGEDGEPPDGWTFTVPPPLGVGPGTTYECTRDEPFDPAAPTYTCRPVEDEEPPPEEPGG